jgi:hypothetical protein
MRYVLAFFLAAGLLLFPFAAFPTDYGSQTMRQVPPVAQTLVREGDFAIKLAAELDLGSPENEASAEDMLTAAGVAPVNGWISDYPMTPEVLGQIQSSFADAAADNKLPMTTEQATKGLYDLASRMGLPTPAGSGAALDQGPQLPADQSNRIVNNYYNGQGPPIITYYAPPPDYVYLYDWVPYPVWWFGFWFPGFFISHDFSTVVVFRSFDHDRRDHDGRRFDRDDHGRRGIVSNHVFDRVTGRVARVEPVVRISNNGIRVMTTLRLESGRTFRTMGEIRSEQRVPGNTVRTFGGGRFSTPEARKNAGAIYNRSVQSMSPGSFRQGNTRGNNAAAFRNRENTVAPLRNEGRPPMAPQGTRSNGSMWQQRSASPGFSRSVDPPAVMREGREPTTKSFNNNGWQGRGDEGNGHAFFGNGCRGGRC